MEACVKVGRRADCARLYKDQMIDAGFINVVEKKYIWPSNRWPKDKNTVVSVYLEVISSECFQEMILRIALLNLETFLITKFCIPVTYQWNRSSYDYI